MITVSLCTVTFVAVDPMYTEAPALKPVPVIVTTVPPVVRPVLGEILEIVGVGNRYWAVNVTGPAIVTEQVGLVETVVEPSYQR